jgi:chromosome partitioning protein
MGKIILVGATKGGVGKSVSSYNLAYSLASMEKRVLAVDFDSQANLTTCFGIEDTSVVPITIGHLMMAQIEDEELPAPSEYIQSRNGVDFIPSSMVLSAVDAKLRLEMGAERMLSNILEPLRDEYDYLIIDTCPALGALTINALAAADGVVITVNPQLLAMMGLQEFLKTIKKIKSRINPKLEVEGILLTMCEARTNLCKVISEQVAETFEGQIRIFESKIPSTVKVGESVYYSEPLLEYAPQTRACKAYLDFGRELIGYESKSA